jgi:hypothetical protein
LRKVPAALFDTLAAASVTSAPGDATTSSLLTAAMPFLDTSTAFAAASVAIVQMPGPFAITALLILATFASHSSTSRVFLNTHEGKDAMQRARNAMGDAGVARGSPTGVRLRARLRTRFADVALWIFTLKVGMASLTP